MSELNTLNNWLISINKKLDGQSFYNLNNQNNHESLLIINDDYLSLFNSLIKRETFTFASLQDVTYINKEMKDYLDQNQNELIIFSSLDEVHQNKVLSSFVSINQKSHKENSYLKLYMTFGTLEFVIENKHYKAPLVFVPVSLYLKNKKYQLKALSDEILLNVPLIEALKKSRKIDLSYPINNAFSLSEYLYYLSVKVKPINWIVNNQVNLDLFDFSYYFDFKLIYENQDALKDNQLIKKLSYMNAEFFSFSRNEFAPLDSKYFSLLNIESEEYQLLKNIATRNNLLVRSFKNTNRYHFLLNIISAYLLNNKRVLVAYSSNKDKEELIKELAPSGLSNYALDLDLTKLNKEDLLASLGSYESLRINYNSLHPVAIDEDLTKYYDIKNNFLSLMNGLRTNKNPIRTSINKLINNYYSLDELPLLDVSIKDIEKIDLEILGQYLLVIEEFAHSIKELHCPLDEHPFYGFNKKKMLKEDYIPLKNTAINLSQILSDAKEVLKYGEETFHLPHVTSLKEYKALLNIIHFASTYVDKELSWLDERTMNLPYDELMSALSELRQNQEELMNLTKPYNEVLMHITKSNLQVYKDKKGEYNLKNFKKKYLNKKVPLKEVDTLLINLESLVAIRDAIEERLDKFDRTIILFLKSHKVNEFIEILKGIKECYLNINYFKDINDFSLKELVKIYEDKFMKHHQVLQYSFNQILDASRTLQEYFDQDIFNFETIDLDSYQKKVDEMASKFSSINEYLHFYTCLNKVNAFVPGLGDALQNHEPSLFKNLFLKRFYFDLLTKYLNSKEFSSNLSRENIFAILDSFKDSDNKRKKIIDRIIINNFHNNMRTKLASIKENEGRIITEILEKDHYQMNLEAICERFNQSIANIKPLILSSFKDVSLYLKNPEYHFDVCLILSTRSIDIKEALPCFIKSDQLLFIDNEMITNDIRSTFIKNEEDTSLIKIAKNTCKEIRYNKEDHSVYSLMKRNLYDLDFKNYLASKLSKHGFDVCINRPIKEQVIDILVKVKNASSSIAIMVDHLPYFSPEEASNTFYYQEDFLKSNAYHPYRIFTSLYFLDEENEFRRLVDYIVTKSKLIPELAISKNSVYLSDYLFQEYLDPRIEYYRLDPKLSLKEKVHTFLNKVAPIALEEIRTIFQDNIEEILNELIKQNAIEIENNFIYLPNVKVEFRRVDRNKDFYRPLDLVSDKELYDAIFKIVDYKSSLNKEVVIKMILLALGYKKYNVSKCRFLEDKIQYLVDNKIIFLENDILYKNL